MTSVQDDLAACERLLIRELRRRLIRVRQRRRPGSFIRLGGRDEERIQRHAGRLLHRWYPMGAFLRSLGKFEFHRIRRLALAQEGCALAACVQVMTHWRIGETTGAPFLLGLVGGRSRVSLVIGVDSDGRVNTDEGWITLDGARPEQLAMLQRRAGQLREALPR